MVTTSEKIAEVGRIEKQLNGAADNNTKNQSEPEAGSANNMQAIVTQTAWGEDRRGVRWFLIHIH